MFRRILNPTQKLLDEEINIFIRMASEQFRIDLLAPTVIKYAQQDKHILDGVTLPNKTRSLIIVHVGPDRNQGHWILVTFENETAYHKLGYDRLP